MKQYVIIGNGVAAAGCIEGIRSADPNGAVTVVSAERHPVYCRPLISYYLEGKTDIERMRYRDAGFYEQNGCRVLYGRSAVRLDAAAKTVELDDGTILPYDSICVAAGSSPFLPPLEGLETVEKAFTFMTLDDALALEAAVKDDSRVLIVGAGLIGLKCAEGLYNRAASITVCDLAGRVLSSVLDDECAARMQRHLEAHGIRFLLGDSVRRLDGKKAYMNGGAVVDFDVLVLAVGVRANTALVRDAGGETNRGILVDESMRTSLPQPAGKATMFLDFNPIFVETAQFLSAKRKIVWLRTILRYAANELRTYRTPPKRHSDVIICPKKDPSPLLYHSSKKAFTRSYFLYTNALK